MIAVVDYGVGNLQSVRHAFEAVGADVTIATTPDDLRAAERIVLPGVGAFGACMAHLRGSGLLDALASEVLHGGKPFLGICVGMQLLATDGREDGVHAGLDWMAGTVRQLDVAPIGLKLPHVGWNDVCVTAGEPLFDGFKRAPNFYFSHSFHFEPRDRSVVRAECEYGVPFVAAVRRDNLFAVQFHPEKSQQNGLRVLRNFLAWRR